MIIDLSNVENKEPRVYIKKEGHFTLKVEEVKQVRVSENGNPIFRFTFKNKDNEYFIDDITITENTKWKIKQIADAIGFTYDRVNIFNFVGMYLVGWLVSKKVKNKHGETVEIFECKQYSKSAKITNEIPSEGTAPVSYTPLAVQSQSDIPEIDINEDIIPF